jgi:hypothetical protein
MLGVVVQIDGFDPVLAQPVSLRAASHDDPAVCHIGGGEPWWPALIKLPTLRYDLFDGAFGGDITAPSSSLTIAAAPWPNLGRYALADARLQLWTGDVGAPWGSWTLRFDGRVSEQPELADGTASINFAVDDRWLDAALLATYAGTSGPEGTEALKGQPKPLARGAPRYAAGTLVDNINTVFQLSAYGPLHGFEAGLERLARFGVPAGDFPSYAALIAANVPAGRWATAKAVGMARLGAPPTGQISFLIAGDEGGSNGWARLPGQVIRRLALLSGGAGRINDASLDALDAARPYNLSIYVDQQTTARQLIQQIAASVNAVAGMSWTGQLFVVPVGIGVPSLTLAADGSALPPVGSVKQVGIASPFQKLAIGAARAWTVHALSDIAFTATLVELGTYADGTTYREGNIVSLADGSRWLYIAATASAGHAPPAGTAGDDYWANLSAPIAGTSTYEDGTPLEDLKPAQPGADVTGDHKSADTNAVGGRPAAEINAAIDAAKQTIDDLIERIDNIQAGGGGDLSQQVNAANAARDAAREARDQAQAAYAAADAEADRAGDFAAQAAASKGLVDKAQALSEAARALAEQKAAEAAQYVASAEGFARTASGQATVATQKANEAVQSASTATASVDRATTKAAEASVSADRAAQSTSSAEGSAAAAASSAQVSAIARDAAQAALARQFPPTLDPAGRTAYSVPARIIGPSADWPQPYIVQADAGQIGGEQYVLFNRLLPRIAGRRYRVRAWGFSYATNVVFFLGLYGSPTDSPAQANAYHGALSNGGVPYKPNNQLGVGSGFFVLEGEFRTDDAAGSAFLDPRIVFAPDDGSPNNGVIHLTGIELTDITESSVARGYAEAASTSASSASASNDQAGQRASAAETSRQSAAGSAGEALAYRNTTADYMNSAAGAASIATNAAGVAASAQGSAERAAVAASGSASTASASADRAGEQAAAADGFRNQAQTSAGQAEAARASAATSESNAAGSASSAVDSAALSASASTASQRALARQFPPTLDPAGRTAYSVPAAIIGPGAGWPQPYIVQAVAGEIGGERYVLFNSLLPRLAGRRYRVRAWGFSYATNVVFFLGLYGSPTDSPAQVNAYHGTLSNSGVPYKPNNQLGSGSGFFVLEGVFNTDDVNSAFLDPRIVVSLDSGSANNGVIHLTGIELTDITESASARGFAEASASSATSAAASNDAAGARASAAETSRLAAETARGSAEAARDTAVTSRNDAAGSANAAASSATLAAASRDTAQGHASAAAGSASVAQASSGAAGNSASAAEQSRLSAEAANGAAQSAAGAANSLAVAADGSRAQAQQAATLSASYAQNAADNAARIAQIDDALSNEVGALARRTTDVEAKAGDAVSKATIAQSAAGDATGKLAAARVELIAMSPGGRAAVTVRSDTNNGAGIDLVGDVRVAGDLIVDGTVITSKIALNNVTNSAVLSGLGGFGVSPQNSGETPRLSIASTGGTMKIDVQADGVRSSGAGVLRVQLWAAYSAGEVALSRLVAFSPSNSAQPVSFFAISSFPAGETVQLFLRLSADNSTWSYNGGVIAATEFKR